MEKARAEPYISSSLNERIQALEAFIETASRMTIVGELSWADVDSDYRLLAINSALRRQLESISAAVLLAKHELGHLAVSSVRPALDEMMHIKFFARLDQADSQELFKLLGKWDSLRSLLAQRAYVGDQVMTQLWYSESFLNAAQQARDDTKESLKRLQRRHGWHGWPGGPVPSADWIADQADKRDLYNYLHAATSRALHFSAGEVLRRGWGHPAGKIITDKREFREHLANFALDQLWRLYIETWEAGGPLLEKAGITMDASLGLDQIESIVHRLLDLGKVPLVHAHEWNLTPEGPLPLHNQP
jgi:hypothetical protein